MNITIFGANGKIGQELINISLKKGDKVKAFVRREGSLKVSHPNLEIIVGNLNNEEQLLKAIKGQDAIISTLGPNLNAMKEMSELPITNAHKMILKTMNKYNVSRFITLATPSVKSDMDKKQIATIFPAIMPKLFARPAYAEMKGIESAVKSSGLDWTVVRIINPNVKTNGNGYTTSLGDTKAKFNVSRRNVAKCMYDAISKKEWIGKMPIVFNK